MTTDEFIQFQTVVSLLEEVTNSFKSVCESRDTWCGSPRCSKCGEDAALIILATAVINDAEKLLKLKS